MTLTSEVEVLHPSTLRWREGRTKYNWLHILKNVKRVSFDTETTGIDQFEPGWRVNGFSIATRYNGELIGEYFPVAHVRGQNLDRSVWGPILELVTKLRVVCHNVKYDMFGCETISGLIFQKFFDTTRIWHMLDENWGTDRDGNTKRPRSLENLCEYVGIRGKTKDPIYLAMLAAYGYPRISSTEMEEYGENDAIITYWAMELLEKKAKQMGEADNIIGYWNMFEQDNFLTLYEMKKMGIMVNVQEARRWELKAEVRMAEIKEELEFDPGKPTDLKPVFYDQLQLPVLYNIKKRKNKETGEVEKYRSPTFDKGAMERYELILQERFPDSTLARDILEYRGWSKANSAYFRSYQELSHDGILRPDYASHGTVTGRFACSKPNLQQIPKESDKEWNGTIKALFEPRPGYELWEFDYAQLEFRLGAHFSRDPKLLDAFQKGGKDIFSEMAIDLGLPRQSCKTLTYSINYGAGAQRIMDVFGYTREEALELIDSFYANYPGLRAVNQHVQNIVKAKGKVKLWSGRYRHFEYRSDAFKAFNSYIQGGGADIVKHVMNRVRRETNHRMLLQIHDALVFELPVDNLENSKLEIQNIMENPTEDLPQVKPWLVHLKTSSNKLGEHAA